MSAGIFVPLKLATKSHSLFWWSGFNSLINYVSQSENVGHNMFNCGSHAKPQIWVSLFPQAVFAKRDLHDPKWNVKMHCNSTVYYTVSCPWIGFLLKLIFNY